jgi:hypothetical protein
MRQRRHAFARSLVKGQAISGQRKETEMRKRIWIVLALMAMLAFVGSVPAWADSPGKVTGVMNLEPPDWGMYFRVWIRFDVHQVNPSTYEAEGPIEARVYNEVFGVKRLWYQAKCVNFGEVDGSPAAIVVGQIVRREGWDDIPTAGNPGEYFKWQLIDGGTPGADGDVWRLQFYDYSSFTEYWPEYPTGGCDDFAADETNYADYGNLAVHY